MYGDLIKKTRVSKQIKGIEMAKLIGFSHQYYDRIEKGASKAKKETIMKICERLELDFEMIFLMQNEYWKKRHESTMKLKKLMEIEKKEERKTLKKLNNNISTKNIEDTLWKK